MARHTYDPGEWVTALEAAGFSQNDIGVHGSWFEIRVAGKSVPEAIAVDLPHSGRVSIADLTREIDRALAYKQSLTEHDGFE